MKMNAMLFIAVMMIDGCYDDDDDWNDGCKDADEWIDDRCSVDYGGCSDDDNECINDSFFDDDDDDDGNGNGNDRSNANLIWTSSPVVGYRSINNQHLYNWKANFADPKGNFTCPICCFIIAEQWQNIWSKQPRFSIQCSIVRQTAACDPTASCNGF